MNLSHDLIRHFEETIADTLQKLELEKGPLTKEEREHVLDELHYALPMNYLHQEHMDRSEGWTRAEGSDSRGQEGEPKYLTAEEAARRNAEYREYVQVIASGTLDLYRENAAYEAIIR